MNTVRDDLLSSVFVRGAAALLFAASVAVASDARSAPITPVKTEAPAGVYTLDKAHATLLFRVDHIGFSNYTAQFKRFDAKLELNPANPAASKVTATIDPKSLDLPTPPAGFLDTLLGAKWFDALKFPAMTFTSTKVELIGANKARIIGELDWRGVKKPVTLEATFNGGYASHPYEPQARIGFSAKGSLKRTDFGVKEGVPPPGTKIGVSDNVDFVIEAEFNGPKAAPKAAAN